MVLNALIAALTCALALFLFSQIAGQVGLLDRPTARKAHAGEVPLVGGLAVFAGIAAVVAYRGPIDTFSATLFVTAAALTLLGALDDRFDLGVTLRLAIQLAAVLVMVWATDVRVLVVDGLGCGSLRMEDFSIPVTAIAVVGLLNAFNLMDGLDGLTGCMALVAVSAVAAFGGGLSDHGSQVLLVPLTAALLPFLGANLGLFGRHVFLGDAGSILMGYLVAWALVGASQGEYPRMSTSDALWCVAVPLFDMLAVMARRISESRSPFSPDRGHVHHLLLSLGCSPRMSLALLLGLAMSLVGLGLLAKPWGAHASLGAFLGATVVYVMLVGCGWRRVHARGGIVVSQHPGWDAP